MAELPDEVTERLSVRGRVRLYAGGDPNGVEAAVAPLAKQLFLLVPRGTVEERLADDPASSFVADDREEGWTVRATGRAIAGRTVQSEPRRAELAHWLPDGSSPAGTVAVRFYPENLEYARGKGADRSRIAGPVPGGASPPLVSRWAWLATEGVVVWYLVMAILDWVGLLVLVDEAHRGMPLLLMMIGAGAALLAGVTLLHQAGRFARWREGLVREELAGELLSGWEAPRRVARVGSGMMAVGAVFTVLIAAGAGWRVGGWAFLVSAAPVLGPFHLARHLMRHRDAEEA